MKAFDYSAPGSVAEVCQILAEHGPDAAILAGGTDLLIESRRASMQAKLVVDISGITELDGIHEVEGGITIGPLTTHTDLLRSGVLQKHAPLLTSAAAAIGSAQIRNRGTIGGNIMNAAACADTLPPLVALGAIITLESRSGTRELDLTRLIVRPYVTVAKPNEILTSIRFPKLPTDARGAFIKLGRRNALSISRLNVASILRVGNDGRITEARIVPGAAFPVWKRITAAEQMLIGEKPGGTLFAEAGRKVSELMVEETGRRWSSEYKEPVLAVLVRRALEQCASRSTPAQSGLSLSPTSHNGGRRIAWQSPGRECRITAKINGRSVSIRTPANRTLLELLRDELGLTGTKCGCEIGECGACTVLLDGLAVNSCLVPAPQIHGREVLTVEGMASEGKLQPLQEAFMDHDAVHCGFCTPGMLMSAKGLFQWNPRPSRTEIRTAISGNLCRCSGYQQIVEAIAGSVVGRQRRSKGIEP